MVSTASISAAASSPLFADVPETPSFMLEMEKEFTKTVDREGAEALLAGHGAGTFLLRAKDANALVVSFVPREGAAVEHQVVYRVDGAYEYQSTTGASGAPSSTLPSVHQVLEALQRAHRITAMTFVDKSTKPTPPPAPAPAPTPVPAPEPPAPEPVVPVPAPTEPSTSASTAVAPPATTTPVSDAPAAEPVSQKQNSFEEIKNLLGDDEGLDFRLSSIAPDVPLESAGMPSELDSVGSGSWKRNKSRCVRDFDVLRVCL